MTVRRSVALAVPLLAVVAGVAAGRGASPPSIDGVSCIRGCAGARTVAVGSVVRFEGGHLGSVRDVRFPAETGRVGATPIAAEPKAVKVRVPDGAVSGRPRLVRANGEGRRSPRALRIVPAGRLPAPGSFELKRARVSPGHAYFDDARRLRLHYRFAAFGRTDVDVRIVRRGTGDVVRRFIERRALPYSTRSRRWDGLDGSGDPPPDGRYELRIGPLGAGAVKDGAFRFHRHRFPVRGPHSYGGALQRFGAPRSGGRTHEGQDVYAACGTALEAARGGTVQARGYHHSLYGYWVLIDGRETRADHFYAHLVGPGPLRDGDRVRTGQRIGSVGKTGNARTLPCHLHFELWPRGYRNGPPIDPLPSLRRWDEWS